MTLFYNRPYFGPRPTKLEKKFNNNRTVARLTGLEPATPGILGFSIKSMTYNGFCGAKTVLTITKKPLTKCRLWVVVFFNVYMLTLRPWGRISTYSK